MIAERHAIKGIPAPSPITSEAQNKHYTKILHDMVMQRNLTAAQEKYAHLLGLLIEDYEEKNHPIPDASPIEVITELMSANNLKQKDLVSVFGSESMVSMVLHGQHPLTPEHVQALGRRFKISPMAFISATE
jgi:HTH-type transcriptional regulator / antitoxin HigA